MHQAFLGNGGGEAGLISHSKSLYLRVAVYPILVQAGTLLASHSGTQELMGREIDLAQTM